MARDIIVLTSITYAYKAQKLLEQAWIKSEVIRTPRDFPTKGAVIVWQFGEIQCVLKNC